MNNIDLLAVALASVTMEKQGGALEPLVGAGMKALGGLGRAAIPAASRWAGKAMTGVGELGAKLHGAATPMTEGLVNRGTLMFVNGDDAVRAAMRPTQDAFQNLGAGSQRFLRGAGVALNNPVTRQIANPFSVTSMLGVNPMKNLPGMAGKAYSMFSPEDNGREGGEIAAAQFAQQAENMPLMQRLGFLMDPKGIENFLPPEVLSRMKTIQPTM
jgi:hypothetical protein